MTKTEQYQQNLVEILNDYSNQKNEANLISYLIANSNLPGPRGNLELAGGAFPDVAQTCSTHERSRVLCAATIKFSQNN